MKPTPSLKPKKVRTMITLSPDVLKSAQGKCQRKGMKLSAIIELFLVGFIEEK